MGSYGSKKILLPNGLDEQGLELSLTRLPNEPLYNYKKRILLNQSSRVDNSFSSFCFSAGRQVGLMEMPFIRLTPLIESARIKITSTRIHVWDDFNTDAIASLSIIDRDGCYFLEDLLEALDALSIFQIETLAENYSGKLTKYLAITDSKGTNTEFLNEKYVNKLQFQYIDQFICNDTLVFSNQVESAEEVNESGDFFLDTLNGVLFNHDLARGYITYDYSNWPLVLYWTPVRVFNLIDEDIDYLIKDARLLDSGLTYDTINSRGVKYYNELLNQYGLEWNE